MLPLGLAVDSYDLAGEIRRDPVVDVCLSSFERFRYKRSQLSCGVGAPDGQAAVFGGSFAEQRTYEQREQHERQRMADKVEDQEAFTIPSNITDELDGLLFREVVEEKGAVGGFRLRDFSGDRVALEDWNQRIGLRAKIKTDNPGASAMPDLHQQRAVAAADVEHGTGSLHSFGKSSRSAGEAMNQA